MKNNTLKTLKIYWQFTWHYKWYSLLTIFGIISASTLQVIVPLYFKKFFDVLASGAPVTQVADKLIVILIIIAVLEFAGWVSWRTMGFSLVYFSSKVMADLSNFCFSKLHLHSFAYFNNNFVGTLVKRVQWFVRAYENVSDRIIFDLTTLLVNIIFIVAVLFFRNVLLGAIVVVWLVIFLTLNYFFSRYKYKFDLARNEAQSEATGYLADTVTNNANVKLFNAYGREKEGFADKQEKVRKLMTWSWNLGEFFSAIQGLFMISLEIGIFYLAIKLWQKNLVTIGDFVLIQAYLINIFNRIWNFGRTIMKMFEGLSDAEEMTIIINAEPDIQDVPKAKNLSVSRGEIEFK